MLALLCGHTYRLTDGGQQGKEVQRIEELVIVKKTIFVIVRQLSVLWFDL